MSDDTNKFKNLIREIHSDLVDFHRGDSDEMYYEFALEIEHEMTRLKPSQYEEFLNLAKAKGYSPSEDYEKFMDYVPEWMEQ